MSTLKYRDPADGLWKLVPIGDTNVAGQVVNLLHNGEFLVSQRGGSGVGCTALASAGGRSGPDRWAVYRPGYVAGAQWSLVPGPAATSGRRGCSAPRQHLHRADLAVPGDPVQRVRSADLRPVDVHLRGQVRADFSAAGGLLTVESDAGTGWDDPADQGLTGQLTGSTTVPLTTTMGAFSVANIALGAAYTQGKVQFGWTPVGTAGANDWIEICAIQLEPGAVAHPIAHLDYATELRRCQYFYNRLAYAANAGIAIGHYYGTTACYFSIQIPQMRAVPLVAVSSVVAFQVISAGTARTCTNVGIGAAQMSPQSIELSAITAAATVGYAAIIRASSAGSIYIDASAEI
jgi:hypothetical protein